jgi:single-stranded DNA-binding protein
VNQCCLVGTLTRGPVVKYEGDGHQIATFTLAVQEPSREGKPYTLYVPCTSFGRAAEACSLLSAEDQVAIVGRLTWQKRLGKCKTEHSVLVVRVSDVQPLTPAVSP